MKLAAIIPIKALATSKSRLSNSLSSSERISLSLNLLEHVLATAINCPFEYVLVLGKDREVEELVNNTGAEWVTDNGNGLNEELKIVFDRLSSSNITPVYIPADLPFLSAQDIERLISDSQDGKIITLCPDNRNEGTNGLVIPSRSSFQPLLGYRSFPRHVSAAKSLDLPYAICKSEGWGLDLDSPDDLEIVKQKTPYFTNQICIERNEDDF